MQAALVSRGWPIWARYSCATLFVGVAALLRVAIFENLQGYPFLLFYPAIIVTGLLFNRGSGIFSCLLSTVLALLFIEPTMQLQVSSRDDLVALALFLVTGLFIASLIEALHVGFVELADAKNATEKLAEQRSLLLRELGHRVQNDLANMAYVVGAEAKLQDNPKAQAALASTSRRLRVLGRVHRRLQVTDQRVTLDGKEYVEGLCGDLRNSVLSGRHIDLETAVEPHQLSVARAVPLGLIINELVTNSVKHAFPDDRQGKITVSLKLDDGVFCLKVGDNGVGSVGDMPSGHGLSLLSVLASQLGGELQHTTNDGTEHTIRFPKTVAD